MAIRGLANPTEGQHPSFMDGDAYADLRLDSALTAYGQLRHNHVRISAQMYDEGGCDIPDGYVEPAIESYRALAAYAVKGRQTLSARDFCSRCWRQSAHDGGPGRKWVWLHW
jgi:hypothetical protein